MCWKSKFNLTENGTFFKTFSTLFLWWIFPWNQSLVWPIGPIRKCMTLSYLKIPKMVTFDQQMWSKSHKSQYQSFCITILDKNFSMLLHQEINFKIFDNHKIKVQKADRDGLDSLLLIAVRKPILWNRIIVMISSFKIPVSFFSCQSLVFKF